MRLARELGLLSSAHIWGRDRKVPRGYHVLKEEGLLGPGHNITHGNYLDDEELRVILDAGVSVTSTPAAELQTHAAEPLMGRVGRLGGRPSIGTDHEVYAGGADMFFAMRFALQTQRLFDNLRRARGELAGEPVVPARRALEWATLNNARAIGLEDRIGSLSPGKEADILLLRREALPLVPDIDPAQAVVLHANPSCVDTVLIGGRAVKEGGRLLHAEDALARKRERLAESRRRLLEV
jgi:cytosine/adenosine deaminase-related metal-dependent hydrolase